MGEYAGTGYKSPFGLIKTDKKTMTVPFYDEDNAVEIVIPTELSSFTPPRDGVVVLNFSIYSLYDTERTATKFKLLLETIFPGTTDVYLPEYATPIVQSSGVPLVRVPESTVFGLAPTGNTASGEIFIVATKGVPVSFLLEPSMESGEQATAPGMYEPTFELTAKWSML